MNYEEFKKRQNPELSYLEASTQLFVDDSPIPVSQMIAKILERLFVVLKGIRPYDHESETRLNLVNGALRLLCNSRPSMARIFLRYAVEGLHSAESLEIIECEAKITVLLKNEPISMSQEKALFVMAVRGFCDMFDHANYTLRALRKDRRRELKSAYLEREVERRVFTGGRSILD